MKKVFILVSGILLLLTVLQITKTFGVFQTIVDDDADLSIAKWNIYVNDYSLNNNNNTFYIDNITYTNNSNVSTNRFAPGVTGTFILEIDPKDTEVSFEYELEVDLTSWTHDQIKVDSITGINGTNLTNTNGVYSRVFTLNEIKQNKKDDIQITFSWDNDESNDEDDSLLGSSDGNIAIPINIRFHQYTQ